MTAELRTARLVAGGPLLIEGPMRVELPDGTEVISERFMVAICCCRRSRIYPLCDTSHRRCSPDTGRRDQGRSDQGRGRVNED